MNSTTVYPVIPIYEKKNYTDGNDQWPSTTQSLKAQALPKKTLKQRLRRKLYATQVNLTHQLQQLLILNKKHWPNRRVSSIIMCSLRLKKTVVLEMDLDKYLSRLIHRTTIFFGTEGVIRCKIRRRSSRVLQSDVTLMKTKMHTYT